MLVLRRQKHKKNIISPLGHALEESDSARRRAWSSGLLLVRVPNKSMLIHTKFSLTVVHPTQIPLDIEHSTYSIYFKETISP